jgi:uncharacterized Zn-binding protein involved in type VI secretion
MPFAARLTDMHTCPKTEPGPVPHVGGPVDAGCATVLIGYQPAARVGDKLVCVGPPDAIAAGASNVLIGNAEAARVGDATDHGGVIVEGCPTVVIGTTPQTEALTAAATTGAPFCEECEKAKRQLEEQKDPGDLA